MKNIFLVILSVLLLTACKSEPVKTETRVYKLTFIDGKTELYTIKNVDVNDSARIEHFEGVYYFTLPSTGGHIPAVIRFKRVK